MPVSLSVLNPDNYTCNGLFYCISIPVQPVFMKKKQRLFGKRILSAGIDIAAIFSLTNLIKALLANIAFINSIDLFAGLFLAYYSISYFFLSGRTAAKYITGLQAVKKSDQMLPAGNIILRELVFKGLIGLLIPIYLFEHLFQIWSPLLTILVMIIVLLLSLIFLILFKKTWWELFSQTESKKDLSVPKIQVLASFLFITTITAASVIYSIQPYLSNPKQLQQFSSHYPANPAVKSYAAFLKNNSHDPVDYVFDLFKQYDIVVLSERLHPEYTQYDLISKIVTDKRFINDIGNIFTEQGSVNFQDTVNTYLHTSFTNEDSLNKATALLQRNSNAVHELWDCTNLFDFLKTVNKLNSALPDSNKIHWYFTDLPINWETTTAENHLHGYTPETRDSIMAQHILENYSNTVSKQKRKKALVIMNAPHGYGLINIQSGISCNWMNKHIPGYDYINNKGTTTYLMRKYPGNVANVLINTVSVKYGPVFTQVQNGKWDAAFSAAGNRPSGFNLSGSPFGEDKFDLFYFNPNSLTYKEVFTGFIFYEPLENHIKKSDFPYMLDNFEDTLLRRAACISPSAEAMWKKRISYHKLHPEEIIEAEPFPYALLYNAVNDLLLPILLLVVLIIMTIVFIKSIRTKNS